MTVYIRRLVETTPPANAPLALSDVKTFLRVDHDADDDLLTTMILAAGQICEKYIDKALIYRNYSLFLDRWPGVRAQGWWDGVREGASIIKQNPVLMLPKPPLFEVGAVYIYDAEDNAVEFSPAQYFVDNAGEPGRLILKSGATVPMPSRVANGIEIQYTAGYGANADSLPMALKQGMKQVVAYLYEHRGDSAEQALVLSGAQGLFDPFRNVSLLS